MATVTETYEMTGPNIIGMRITVYHLVPYFLKPNYTEQQIQELYPLLSLRQVAAARAYFLANYDAVMKRHLEIEARNAAGNPPEVREYMAQLHEKYKLLRHWYANRRPEEMELRGKEMLDAYHKWRLSQAETADKEQ